MKRQWDRSACPLRICSDSTDQTHGLRMKVGKNLTHVAMPENFSQHFGEHRTIVEEDFETAWPRNAQRVSSGSIFLRQARPLSMDLSSTYPLAHCQHRKATA